MSPEAWSALANWVMAAAAVAAAGAAILGINSWKKQSAWLMERDAARNALRSLLRLASEVNQARKPEFMRLSFGKVGNPVYPTSATGDIDHLRCVEAVQLGHRELESAMFDLEYLGDIDLKRAWMAVDRLVNRYLAQTDIYLRWKHREFAEPETGYFRSESQRKENYGIVFSTILTRLDSDEPEKEDFDEEFYNAVNALEGKLAEKLGGGV